MFWAIIMVFVVLWLLALVSGIGGSFIHVLLMIAGLVLIFNLLRAAAE
jgi:uncharacterized protein DUF5670